MDLLDDYLSTSSSEEETTAIPAPEVTRKARKLLSLSAVLPPAILDKLTRRHIQGNNMNDDSSEEDEEEESSNRKNKKQKQPVSKDGMSNLLSALHAVKPASSLGGSHVVRARTPLTKPTELGTAFLQTTTTIVPTGTGSVRNIHDEENSFLETDDKEDDSLIRSSTPRLETTVKRLSSIRPIVQSAPSIMLSTAVEILSSDETSTASKPTNDTHPLVSDHMQQQHQEDNHHRTKRSRREMENALRNGNFQQLTVDTPHLHQARPDSFVPDPETYAVPVHGIRVVPTAMYDPKAGTTAAAATGKGRGKNQIHHLMASAAQLELQRARGMAGTANASTQHRANAKQKYGW